MMSVTRFCSIALFLLMGFLVVSSAQASGPSAVYALVDRVDYEPNQAQATKVRVYGIFSLADPNDQASYLKPVAGYMYLDCPTDSNTQQRCRVEWGDIANLAGNSQKCAAFGDRTQNPSKTYRIRPLSETPSLPDMYTPRWGIGVQEVEFGVCQDVKNAKQAMNEPSHEQHTAESTHSTDHNASEPTHAADHSTSEPTHSADHSTSEPTHSADHSTSESTHSTEPTHSNESIHTEHHAGDASTSDTHTGTDHSASTETSGQEHNHSSESSTDTSSSVDKDSGNNPDTSPTKPTGCACQADPKEMGLSLVFLLMIVVLLRWRRSSAPQQA